MSKIHLAGTASSALTHLAMIGLAGILQDAGALGVRVWWEDDVEAVATVASAWTEHEVAETVLAHARRHAAADSWVQQAHTHEGGLVGLFSPRVKAATSGESWENYSRARAASLASDRLTDLDHRMIGALGEPAWWPTGPDVQPDRGASRWEMKTRNRGEDFVRNRLAVLAQHVAARNESRVLGGLTGATSVDEAGKNASTSRTPTGLTQPGATDNALAWCALWGIAHTMTIPQLRAMSQSVGTWPRNRVHPDQYLLPVVTRACGLSRWRLLLVSREFDAIVTGKADVSSHRWLIERGVRAVVRFSALVGGSSSAPERALLAGRIEVLDG